MNREVAHLGRVLSAGAVIVVWMSTAMLAGCATTNTTTNRDLGYTGHPARIFIVSNLGKFGDSFSNELQKQMIAGIESCGGHAVFDRVSPTELDPTMRNRQIAEFKADVVLSIQLANWETQDGSIISGNVDSRVWDVSTKKTVWRASSSMHMGTITPASTQADSLYKDLIPKLRSDGMIPSCAGG
jgi:hypothetical protein